MRLHRFFVRENIDDKTEVNIQSSELVNQIQRVFRLKKDDSIIIFDGSGFDYECFIMEIKKDQISLKIIKKENSRYMPKRNIYLCAGIVKKDKFEWIVEKATELGVTKIIPIITERSEKKSLNEERLKKIAIEASEQSGRGDVPVIGKIMTIEEFIKEHFSNKSSLKVIVFHTEGSKPNLDKNSSIAFFVGPEGGWSPKEIEMFHENNIDTYCLGDQVLRSETAVIAALSQIVF